MVFVDGIPPALLTRSKCRCKGNGKQSLALSILSLIYEYINEGIQDALSFHYLDDKAILIHDTLRERLELRVLIVVVYHAGLKPLEGVLVMCIRPS